MPVHFLKHGPVRIENCGRCGLEEGTVIHRQNRTYIFHRPCPQMGFYQLITRCIFLPGTITEGYQAHFCLFPVQFPEKFRETDLKANPDPQTDSVNLKNPRLCTGDEIFPVPPPQSPFPIGLHRSIRGKQEHEIAIPAVFFFHTARRNIHSLIF